MPGAYGTLAGVGPTTHNDACEGGMEHDEKAAAGIDTPKRVWAPAS